jgi:hypothetical protein
MSASDAQLMADNDIKYTAPVETDTYNEANPEMAQDVYDPSEIINDTPEVMYGCPEQEFHELTYGDDMLDMDPGMDIIDPIA